MEKIIVTGANGFIGNLLIKRFLDEMKTVIAIDVSFNNCQLPKSSRLKIIEDSLQNVDNLASIIDSDCDLFYHLAWRGVNGKEKADPEIQLSNITAAINATKLAKLTNCKKILFAGTISERAVESLPKLKKVNGGITYSCGKYCSKIMVDACCKTIGLNYIWMQFSNIFGPTNKTGNLVSYTIEELKKERAAIFGPASQPYDFVYIDDLIEAVYRLGFAENNEVFYYIGSGEPRILKEYLIEIGEKMGKKHLIKIGERPDDGIFYSFDMFKIDTLERDIGKYVSTSFSEGINKTIKNMNNRC